MITLSFETLAYTAAIPFFLLGSVCFGVLVHEEFFGERRRK